jgi:NitT/TauT family transport system substrate-binding protein
MKKQLKKKSNFFVALTTIAAVFLCYGIAGAADEVNYRLKWLYNASVIGDIYAEDQGFFSKKNLKVNVKEGGPERNAIREIELGHAQFGVASADQVIRAVAKGSPMVVIAQLFQVNPLHWIYRSNNMKIEKLMDLKGKIVGITFGGNDENIMRTLMAKANITENDITVFSVRYDLTPFYQKKADVWPCYLNSQGVILKQKLNKEGEQVAFINPADYGVKFVANSVITSAQILEKNPDMVKRFVGALMEGWKASLEPANEKKAMITLRKYEKGTAEDIQVKQLAATRPLIQPTPDTKIGTIDIDAWKQTEQIMLKGKQIKEPVHVENTLKPYPKLYR